MSSKLGMFIGGACVGAAAALLCAPRSGAETRAMVCNEVDAMIKDAQQAGTRATEVAYDAADAAQDTVEAVIESDDPVGAATDAAQGFAQKAVAKGQEVAQQAKAKGQEVAQQAQEVYGQAKAKGQEVYGQASSRVQGAAENLRPAFASRNDDLREKIEEARSRIAAQVARNAEEAAGAAEPVAAEPVEPAAAAEAEAATPVEPAVPAEPAAVQAAPQQQDEPEA